MEEILECKMTMAHTYCIIYKKYFIKTGAFDSILSKTLLVQKGMAFYITKEGGHDNNEEIWRKGAPLANA
eukprot:8397151-Prorocentrum_lima.AAC.1